MTDQPNRKPPRWLLVLFLAALLLRGVYLYQVEGNPFFYDPVVDSQTYVEHAREIVDVSFMGDKAFWQPPLYPYFLALIYKLTGDFFLAPRIVQILLGALCCVFIFRIGRDVFGKTVGWIAAIAACLYGPLIYFEGELLPVSLAVFFDLLLLLILLAKPLNLRWGAIAGVVLGLAALTVANILLFAPFIVLWAWFARRMSGGEDAPPETATPAATRPFPWIWLTGIVAGTILIIAPVTIRNYSLSRDFVPISWNAGVNFYIGNNADYDRTVAIRPGPEWEELTTRPDAERLTRPSERSGYFFRQAFAYMADQPLDWLALMGRKAFLFWRGDEIKRNQDAYFMCAYSPLLSALLWKIPHLAFPFGLVGACALLGLVLSFRRSRPLLLLHLFTVVYFVSVLLFFVTGRYRVPLVPLFLLFGAQAVVWLIRNHKAGKRGPAIIGLVFVIGLALVLNSGLDLSDPLDDPEIHFTMGTIYLQKQMYDEAEAAYRETIRLDPKDLRALHNQAVIYRMRGKYADAIASYEQAKLIDPDEPNVYYYLANVYLGMGERAKALEQYELATERFERLIEERTVDGLHVARNVLIMLGSAYMELERYDEALDTYELLFSGPTLGPDALGRATFGDGRGAYAEAANNMGFIHIQRNDPTCALAEYERALRYLPRNPEILYNKASALEGLDRKRQAIEAYRQVLAVQPDHEKARKALERLK